MTSNGFSRKLRKTLATVIATMVTALVFTSLSHAQTFNVIYNFLGSPDGAGGYNGLVQMPPAISTVLLLTVEIRVLTESCSK